MRTRTLIVAATGLIAGLLILALWRTPRIITWIPDANEIRAGQSIFVESNIPVDLESLKSHFQISPPVSGTLSVDGRNIRFEPAGLLEYDQSFAITFSAGIKGENGLPSFRIYQNEFSVSEPELIYVLESNGHANLWKVDGAGSSTQISDESNGIWDFSILPNGDGVLVSALDDDGSDDLVRVLLNGDRTVELECHDFRCRDGRWQPNGSLIAFERSDIEGRESSSEVWLLDSTSDELWLALEYASQSEVGTDSEYSRYPRWSADGRFLSFYQPDAQQIIVLDTQGGNIERIPANVDTMGGWSPTANQIAFTELVFDESDPEPPEEDASVEVEPSVSSIVRVVDIDNGIVIDLDRGSSFLSGVPVWSPDGSKIATSRITDGVRQIWAIPFDGSEPEALTEDQSFIHSSPSWSPDGRHIAFMRSAIDGMGGPTGIWVLEFDDGEPLPLADGAYIPRWLP